LRRSSGAEIQKHVSSREDSGFTIVEHPSIPRGSGLDALSRWVDPQYFNTIGIPILRGRTLDPSKRLEHADEIVISQAFVEKVFPGRRPAWQTPQGRRPHARDRRRSRRHAL
jgi:hypothetical protein